MWQRQTVGINGAPRGGKDKSADVGGADPLQDVEESVKVHGRIRLGISHRASDINLRSMMIHKGKAATRRESSCLETANVGVNEFRSPRHILPASARQVVQHSDVISCTDVRFRNMRPDKTSPTCYQDRCRHHCSLTVHLSLFGAAT